MSRGRCVSHRHSQWRAVELAGAEDGVDDGQEFSHRYYERDFYRFADRPQALLEGLKTLIMTRRPRAWQSKVRRANVRGRLHAQHLTISQRTYANKYYRYD